MCGILGILSQSPLSKRDLKAALPLLYHRGPDDQGIWSDSHIQLGHTRLAILDLSSLGHQPMSYQNERFWITFNGEVYNYVELRQELSQFGYQFSSQTDTEVLLAAYTQWGVNCLDKLRGMFAFGIWDRDTESLFLARDRTGEKPLYYWFDQNTLYFASELKALLHLLPTLPTLDPVAIDLYLHYQYVPEPRTPLIGIHKLPAAHYVLIDCKHWQFQPEQYWSMEQIQPREGDATKLIRQELDQIIELTLRSDVPIGIALSGGLDSGSIAGLAAPRYKNTLQALSVGYEGHPPCDERSEAAELAQWLGIPFHEIELSTADLVSFFPKLIRAIDDPIADIAAYGLFSVTQLASDLGIKVILNGLGGDELFLGYSWVLDAIRFTQKKQSLQLNHKPLSIALNSLDRLTQAPIYEKFANSPKLPSFLHSGLQKGLKISYVAPQHPQQFTFYNVRHDFRNAWHHREKLYTQTFLAQLSDRNPYEPFVRPIDWENIPNQICQLMFDTWLASNCLPLSDRTSMASAVEVRVPFLDHKLIELVIGLRQQQPDHNYGHKYWLRSALKGVLPNQVLQRKKRGFEPPYDKWISALLKKYHHLVLSGYLVELGFFKAEYIQKLFVNYHKNYLLVYKLIVLEIWYRSIILNENTAGWG